MIKIPLNCEIHKNCSRQVLLQLSKDLTPSGYCQPVCASHLSLGRVHEKETPRVGGAEGLIRAWNQRDISEKPEITTG